ncbi:hypothetical protein RSAG8_07137, partial [Rhizoctonia solani AG-8 WAC10335]
MRGELCIGSASALSFMMMETSHLCSCRSNQHGHCPPSGLTGDRKHDWICPAVCKGRPETQHLACLQMIRPLPLAKRPGCEISTRGVEYCAYTEKPLGQCANQTFGFPFKPFDTILGDTPELYQIQTRYVLPQASAFTDSAYLADYTRAGFWLVFLGTLAAGIAFLSGLHKSTMTFMISTVFSMFGAGCLLIGASILTAVLTKAKSINNYTVADGTPLGIVVSTGSALSLIWAAFVMLFMSMGPYLISCSTFRK